MQPVYLSNALINLQEDAYDVFRSEEMIEPGESIQEQLLVALEPPLEARVLRVEFVLYAGDRFRWKTEKIILLQNEGEK